MNDFPYVAPEPNGLNQAMAQARVRRYRTAGFSTTTVAASFVVLAALAGGQGTQSLIERPAPEQPAITQLVPGPAHDRTATRNIAGAVATFGARGRGSVAGPPATRREAAVGSVVGHQGSSSGGITGKPYAAGPITRQDNSLTLPDTGCTVTGKTEDATRLCPSLYLSQPNNAGDPYTMDAEICSTRTTATNLHFTGRNEIDLTVVRRGDPVWHWGHWHPDGGSAHVLTLASGSCDIWTFAWTGVDASGRALPKGDYVLKATFLAAEVSDRNVVSVAFSIT